MNSGYESDLYTNFEKALNLCNEVHSQDDLFEMLTDGNFVEKQFAALEINEVKNLDEASIFISNLVGCDGKIREAIAYKFQLLVQDKNQALYFLEFPETFAKSTIDINANICRMVIDGLKYLKDDEPFGSAYTREILSFTEDALSELDKFIFRDKKYMINKQLFKLYWCLEALTYFHEYVEIDKLSDILTKCSKVEEYTIREKVAQILKNDIKSEVMDNMRDQLKNDSNYYVKNI